MKSRILVAIPLIICSLFIIIFDNLFVAVIVSLFALAGTYEVSHVSLDQAFRPLPIPAYLFAFAFPYILYFFGNKWTFLFFTACFLASAVLVVVRRPSEPENIVISLFLYIFPIFQFVCLALVLFGLDAEKRLAGKLIVFIIPCISDALAYFVGRKFGKHKLCPSISPKKSVEGAVAGVVSGTLTGVIIVVIQLLTKRVLINPFFFVLTCFLCSIFGIFGDLLASLYKRWGNTKDYSNVFKEHGGVMDRLDSILLCSPVVFLLFSLI